MNNNELNARIMQHGKEALDLCRLAAKTSKSFDYRSVFPERPTRGELGGWYDQRIKKLNSAIDRLDNKYHLVASCSPGCSHCCYHPVGISQFEAEIISDYLTNLPNNKTASIIGKIRRAARAIKTAGLSIDALRVLGEEAGAERYHRLSLPCPLLAADNRCVVYDVRPAICAFFRNYGSSENCLEPLVKTLGIIDPWIELLRMETKFLSEQLGLKYHANVRLEHLAVFLSKQP